MRNITHILAAAALLGCLVSCEKEVSYSRRPGAPVVFTTRGAEQPATKAVYESGTEKGAIYWETDDVIRIYSTQASTPDGNHYADYVLTPRAADASRSDIAPYEGGNGLNWGSGLHYFYCLYPSPISAGEGFSLTGGSVSFPMPPSQTYASCSSAASTTTFAPDIAHMPMVACATAASENGNGSAVSLEFKAQFTAFEFVVKSDDSGALSLTSFEFSSASTDLAAASASATISGTGEGVSTGSYTLTGTSRTITFTLGTGGEPFVLEAGKTMVFTVFALAKENITDCSIKFNTTSGYRSLALKYDADYFAANSTTLTTAGTANASGYLIFPKGKKITLMGFNVPGKFYIAFNDITIGGQPYTGDEAGDYWERRLQEVDWNGAVIGGQYVAGQTPDGEWGLVNYDMAWEKFVIGGQDVSSQDPDSAWKPILDPLPDPIGTFTAGGQEYDGQSADSGHWTFGL